MSGSAGGNRIPRSAVEKTVQEYIDKVLSKIPYFKSAKISGSYNTSAKQDFGDIDLITSFEGEDKKEFKKQLSKHLESLPDDVIVPFKSDKYKGKKTLNTGEIVTVLYPITGMPGEFVQIDNIISLSEEESEFKKTFLDYPAEIQGLILGLVKVVTLEEDPNKVIQKMGIKNIPALEPGQEYEFNLSSAGLTLRIVTLDKDYKQLDRTEVWKSSNWADVKKLLSNYNLDKSFEDLLKDLKSLKNERSKNRIRGIFKSMVSIKSGEVGTAKGDKKQYALDQVATLEEKYGKFVTNLIRPILEADSSQTVAIYPGGFKPPHRGHLQVIQNVAPKVDKMLVIYSTKTRQKPGQVPISATQTADVWQLYIDKGLIPSNVEIRPAQTPTPVQDAYEIMKANPNTNYIALYGKDEEGAWKSIEKYKKQGEYLNVVPTSVGNFGGFNATAIRTALANNDMETLQQSLPDGITTEEYLQALEGNSPQLNPEPIQESKGLKKLRVFDFDDTLAHIQALIRITHQDGSVKELTPAEYAIYTPQTGDKFNFSDFNKVIKQAHPIEDNVQDLIRSYNDPTEKTTILTARMMGYPVKKYLKDEFGIEPYVVGLGSSDPMDKAKWIEQQIHKGYNDIEFRDDSQKNVDAVATLKDKYPDVKLVSMLAESYKGKRTNDGAPGTFKAKITKAYGGPVTIEKAKKFKNRENATPHDKRQANWFINFHSKNEGKAAPYGSGYKPLEEQLTPLVVELTKYMYDQGLSIDPAPSIEFIEDESNAENIFGRTAYYDPQNQHIVLYITGRHPKDILRSFAHEMIHHAQNLEGKLEKLPKTTDINEDDHLKEIEREAYETGNMMFRGWENSRNKQVMAEGKYDTLSNELSSKIFSKWKKDFEAGKDASHFEWFVMDERTGLEFDLKAHIDFVDQDIYSVDGGANQGSDLEDAMIEAEFTIDKQALPEYWEKISFDLKDFMRHEIEHLTQSGVNELPGKRRKQQQARRAKIKAGEIPTYKYATLRDEIEPMLQGMYFSAKKQRRPFRDVVEDWFDSRGFTNQEKIQILKTWQPYLKQLSLPNL